MPTSAAKHSSPARISAPHARPDLPRLGALVDAGPEAVAILGRDWRYTYVNAAFEGLIQQPAGVVLGREVWTLSPSLRGSAFEQDLRKVMSARQVARLEFTAQSGRCFEIHAIPFGDGMAFFARDVTELRRATIELRQKEERFRAILNTEPGCVLLLDCGGRLLDTNPAGLDLLEVDSYDDVLGLPIAPFVANGDRQGLQALNERVFEGGSASLTFEIVGRRGTRRRVEHRAVPLRDAAGAIVAALSITTDVTQQYEVEATLRHRALQQAALASLGALALRDTDVDALTRVAVDAISEALRVPAVAALDLLGRHGLASPGVSVAGEMPSESVRLDPQDADFVRSAAHLVRSASERRRAEHALLEREDQLRQAQKMEAIGQLAGGVAHDFNNLLTIINVHSDLLLQSIPREMRADVEEISRAATRAAALTRQLLMFSRKQAVQPQVLDLARVITGMEPMLQRLIGEDLDYETVVNGEVDHVVADEGEIEQVLINLVVNARDAMPQGGRLRVELSNVAVDQALCVRHQSLRTGRYVLLTVSDTGVGMTAETMARAFEPFYTTKEPGRGTGLGLSMVFGIVKQCGGTITVDSMPGSGTTICVYLPKAPATASIAGGVVERRPVQATGETVLLVEDEDTVRRLGRRVLESQGYTVLEAINGEDALRIATDYAGVIDLLVSDVVMPELGGGQLAERVTNARPEMEVLFVTGYNDDDILRRGLLRRGQRLLQKPFTASALAHEVRAVLDAKKSRRLAGLRGLD
ncbi:MAG TPA: PAS domain-containing protein [Gemmatimonadaceae bacterium]|nr:PAS domain-containing protein [Gemmatimonadaceae bacterium]